MPRLADLLTREWDAAFTPFPGQLDVQSIDEGVPTHAFDRGDVVEVAHLLPGKGDGPDWVTVIRLADGRWVYVRYGFGITGDFYWSYIFAASRRRLWWGALTEDDRSRLAFQLSREEAEDELVKLDHEMESHDPLQREQAADRAARMHRLISALRPRR